MNQDRVAVRRRDHLGFFEKLPVSASAEAARAMIAHGSGNSTCRTGTGLSAHLDDDFLTDFSGDAESCDSAT